MQLKILSLNNSCTGCGACVSICSKDSLKLTYNDEGFYYPELDENLCVDCKRCEKVCHALKDDLPYLPDKNYIPIMLKAKSRDIVKKSSSGGAFSLLAAEILKDGGIVYGARYNYELERLEHASTDQYSIDELRKSKYIESYMGDTFRDVRKKLQSGRCVMFCGAPCQVRGLSDYLAECKVPVTNLLLLRFICHGVPSNLFFTEYKHYIEKKMCGKMTHFDFRPKTRGWRSSDILMAFSNKKVVNEPYFFNYYYYYYYFQKNYLLRTSCYGCKQTLATCADITIADFWGIYKYRPENKDEEGISLVLQHTEKGKNAIAAISSQCETELLPQNAVYYIYDDLRTKAQLLGQRAEMMKKVKVRGYMKVAKDVLGRKIMQHKARARLRDFLQKVGLLKIIRKLK